MKDNRRYFRIAAFLLSFLLLLPAVTACGAGNNQKLGEYLAPYEEEAIAYLLADEEFLGAYGADCTAEGALDASGFSFTYKEPEKYTSLSFSPKIPASAEEFAQEVTKILVSFYLPDGRAVSVRFDHTPEGTLEITGWEYSDEE